MTEKELMLAGKMYDPSDPQLVAERQKARQLFRAFNACGEQEVIKRADLLLELLPAQKKGLYIEPPFYCDYGYNIILGEQVYMNFNCCILDVMPVEIGHRVMMAPGVHIYTATHPLNAKARNSGREFAKPVTIGNDVWIGGGAIICPGVSIGNGVVIGAGAVVTRNVPDNVLVAGNPARVIKDIDQGQATEDRIKEQEN
jgi:maltose O-acetyltransferase